MKATSTASEKNERKYDRGTPVWVHADRFAHTWGTCAEVVDLDSRLQARAGDT